ncbi:MAG: hypothetical protein LN588_00525 [Rickettsia endosymbiont of Bryobia graminum]|nr:hypothetical protein [Rickettsia endosymbiont of Bryobia graminum]
MMWLFNLGDNKFFKLFLPEMDIVVDGSLQPAFPSPADSGAIYSDNSGYGGRGSE